MAITLYDVTLPSGRTVAFRELSLDEYTTCFELAKGGTPEAKNFDAKVHGCKMAVHEIDGRPTDYVKLKDQWPFTTKDTLVLVYAWTQVHEPSAAEVGKSPAVRVSGT